MKSTFWMTAKETEVELKSREIPKFNATEYTQLRRTVYGANLVQPQK